ncbi:MAG: hypothetical protein JWN49_277 [Parcubacteria group bacterium]|nr:hypothetical protein [Parcubacteria group bacterium]
MQNEIERKFFVKEMPDLSHVQPLRYERYFIERSAGKEERISKVNDKYFYEKKTELSNLERTREKREISAEEFESLKKGIFEILLRDRYDLTENPKISVQIYHDKYEGLVRAEVEFASVEEAQAFQPLDWMGAEMTDLPISRDAKLLDLTDEEFRSYLH